jgi:hypothetical protein
VSQYATDFYQAITTITSGLMLPLTTADLLSHAIVGSVLENLDMERLVREVGHAVAQRILGNNESVDDVARELHEKLLLRNESTKKVVIESIYKESPEAMHNVAVFTHAASLHEAKSQLKRVRCAFTFLSRANDFHCQRCKARVSRKSTSSHDRLRTGVYTHIRIRLTRLRDQKRLIL